MGAQPRLRRAAALFRQGVSIPGSGSPRFVQSRGVVSLSGRFRHQFLDMDICLHLLLYPRVTCPRTALKVVFSAQVLAISVFVFGEVGAFLVVFWSMYIHNPFSFTCRTGAAAEGEGLFLRRVTAGSVQFVYERKYKIFHV